MTSPTLSSSETPEIYGGEDLLTRRALHGYTQNEFVPWQLGAIT